MIHIQTQSFYEKHTGDKHEVTIMFGHISPVSRGRYEVQVDGGFYSDHDSKRQAFDEIVDIIKVNNWTPLKPF